MLFAGNRRDARLRTSILLLLMFAFAALSQTSTTNLASFLTTNRFPDGSTIKVEAVSYGVIHRIPALPEQEPKFLKTASPTIMFTTRRQAFFGRRLGSGGSGDIFTEAEALDPSGNWYPLNHDEPLLYEGIAPTEMSETWDFPNCPKPSTWVRVRVWATRNGTRSACVEFKLPNDAAWRERSIKEETKALHSPEILNGELWLAAERGDAASVKDLITQGADPNSCNSVGTLALAIACQNGHLAVVSYLLDHGVDVNAHSKGKQVNCTALMASCSLDGLPAITRLLVERGADVNIKGDSGWTALISAATCGQIENVKYLLSKGADPNIKDRDGKSIIELTQEAKTGLPLREETDTSNRLEAIKILKNAEKRTN